MPVLAAAVVVAALGPLEPQTLPEPSWAGATQSASGKSSLLTQLLKSRFSGVPTPLGTLTPQTAAMPDEPPAAVPASEAAPSPDSSAPSAEQTEALMPTEVPQGSPSAPLEVQSAQPAGLLLSQAADIPQTLVASLPPQAGPATPPPATDAAQEAKPAPIKPQVPAEKPPRVAEYHWFETEPKDGATVIGYGHPRRPRGEFLVGFTCKPGSGKATFIMYEAGLSRTQFTKGQKVSVTLEVGVSRAIADGIVEMNEAANFPMASATISADDALFKAMDDDVKVLRIDIDGWSAAVQLILIKDVMPAFTKTCGKKKKPEATAKAPAAAVPAKAEAPAAAAAAKAEVPAKPVPQPQ
jgi:hypothetical protein